MANEPKWIDDKWSGTGGFGDSADTSSITSPPPPVAPGWGDLITDTGKLWGGETSNQIGSGEQFIAPYAGAWGGDPNAWRQSGEAWKQTGQQLTDSVTPGSKEITNAPFFSMETLQHPIDKTMMGIGKGGLWDLAFVPGGGVAGMAGRAALGGALGYTGAYGNIIDTIKVIPDDQLQKNSPTYAEMRKTLPEWDAKYALADQGWSNIPVAEKAMILGVNAVAGEAGPLATVGKTVAGSVGRTLTARYAEGRLAKAGLNAVETGGVMGAQYAGTAIPTRDALGNVGVQGDTNADIIKGTIENTAMGAVIGGGTRYVRPHGGKNESRSDTRGEAVPPSGAQVGEVPAGQADPAEAAALQSVTGFEQTYHGPATGYEMQYPPEPPRSMPPLYTPPPPTGFETPYEQPIPPRPPQTPTGYEQGYTPPETVQNIKPPFTVPPPGTQRPLGINVPDQPERPGARGPQGELPLRPPQTEPVQGELPLQQPGRGITQLGLPGMDADVTHEAAPATTISADQPLAPIKSAMGYGPDMRMRMRSKIDTGEPPDDTSGGEEGGGEPPPTPTPTPTKPKPSGGGAATVRSKMAKPPATKDSDQQPTAAAAKTKTGPEIIAAAKPAARAAEPTSKAKGSPAQAAWYLLSDPQRGALQEHLTGVLEKKGSLSWEDIPKGYTAKFGVSEATSIKQGFKDDPHEAIATLDPDYGRKGKDAAPAAKGDDTLAARTIMEQRERAARRKSNAEVKARGAPTLPGEGQPTVVRSKFDETKVGTGEAVAAGATKIKALAKGEGGETETPTGEIAGAPKMPQPSRKQEIKVTHKSSNIDSLKAGWEKRDLGISFARDSVQGEKAYSSSTVGDAEGRKGTVKATVKGKGLDYDIPAHKAYIEKLHDLAEKLPGHRDVRVMNHLRANGIDWVSGWNGIGHSGELHVLNPDAVKIDRITPDKELKTVPSKGEVPVTKLEPTDARLSGVVSDEAAKEAARKAAAEGVATVRRKQKEAADKLAAERKAKTPLVKTNSMRALLEELGYSHDDFKRMKLADVQRIIQTGERKVEPGSISDEGASQDTEPRAKGGGTSDVLQRTHDLPDEKEGSESVNQNPTEEGSIEAAKADVDQNATPAQLVAGNFKQGHVTVDGQQVTIHSAEGEEGQAEGHILGTADNTPGEHLETIIDKDQLPNKTHVVNMIDKDTGEFAGHVAVLGAKTEDHALHSYQTILKHKYGAEVEDRLADLSAGVVEMTPEQFDNWQGTRNPNEPVHPTDTGKHPFNEVESFGKKIKGRDVQGSSTLHTALEEALRRIPDTKQYIIYRQLARMIMKYLPDVPIYYIKSEAYDKVRPGTNAVYNATKNHILVSSALDPTTTHEVTLLHEAMHAATMHLYLNNKAFRGLVDTILTEYKAGMPGINGTMSHNVRSGGGKELLAELADPKVANQLGRIQMSETLAKRLDMDTWAKNTQTLWNGLVTAFKRTLEGMGFAVPGRDAASRFNLLEGMLKLSDDAFMARSKHARTDFGNMIRAAKQHGADSATTIDSEHNSQQNIYDTIHDAVSNPEGLRRAYQSGADSITSKASDLVDRLPRGTFKQNAAEYVWPFIGGDALRMNHEGNFGEKTEANPHRRVNEAGLRRDSYLSKLVNKTNDIIHDMFKETRDHTREQVEHLSDTLSNATAFRADPRYKVGEGANEWMTKPGWQWRNEAKQAIANHARITKMYNDIAPGLKPRFTKLIDEYSRAGAEQAELGAKELIDSITNAGQKFLPELKVIDTKDVKLKSRQEYIKFHNDWETNWEKNKEVLRKHLLNNELTDDEERWLAERGFKDISDIRDLATPRGPFVPLDHAGEFILDGRMKIEAPANGKLVDGTDNVFRFKTEAEAEAFLNKQPPRSSMSTVHFNDEGKQVPKWDTWQNPDGSVGFAKNNKAWHVEVNDKYYSGHDSISAANKRYEALKASGKFAKLSPPMSKRSGWYSGLQISSPLFKHLISEVEKRTDYTDGQKKAVIQLLKDSALSSMEGNRIAKHMLPRKAVAGWDTDYIKTYKSYFDAHNALMSRAKYAKDINDATNEMIKYADDHQSDSGSGPTNRSLVLNELNKRDNFFGTANDTGSEGPNKTVGRVMKYAEAASYFANMISPGHVIVHQTHQILTADMLAAKYGPVKTMARASKMHSTLAGTGFKNVLSSVKEIYNVITKDSRGLNYVESLMDKVSQDPKYGAGIRAMLEEAIATNRLHPDQGFDASVLHMGSGRFDRGLARLDLASRQTMGATEAYSRVWGYSLGYTLARDAGETHEQAMRTAFDSVSRTQGMLSRSNMSRVMNKWYMRAPMQFRAWGVNMMVTLAKSIHDIFKPDAPGVRAEAVRRLLYLFGTTMALTGINGLPSDAMRVGLALTNALNLTDYDWADAQNSMREYFAEKTSSGVANFLMDGALASLGPFSFFGADRVGFGSLAVFGEPDDHTKGSFAKWILGIMGGAPFEKVWDIGTGIKALKEGDYAKATEALVPLKIIDDWAKAWQGAYQGFPTKTGAPGMEPYSMGETFMQSLGLTPDRKERWREASNTEYRAETAIKDEKNQLLNGLGTATTEPDRMKARMQIAAYNLRNPDSRIGSQDMMKALRRQTAPAGLGRTLYRGNRERIQHLQSYYGAY